MAGALKFAIPDTDFVSKANIIKAQTQVLADEVLEQFVRDTYDLTPRGILNSLKLLDVDYNKVSACGHFGKDDLPWEQ